jgi:hypothetical protein
MKAIKDFIMSLFGVGGFSMMRFLTFFVVIDIMVMWTISIIKNDFDMQDIPLGVAGIFTAMVASKMGQRFAENGGEKKPIE